MNAQRVAKRVLRNSVTLDFTDRTTDVIRMISRKTLGMTDICGNISPWLEKSQGIERNPGNFDRLQVTDSLRLIGQAWHCYVSTCVLSYFARERKRSRGDPPQESNRVRRSEVNKLEFRTRLSRCNFSSTAGTWTRSEVRTLIITIIIIIN